MPGPVSFRRFAGLESSCSTRRRSRVGLAMHRVRLPGRCIPSRGAAMRFAGADIDAAPVRPPAIEARVRLV